MKHDDNTLQTASPQASEADKALAELTALKYSTVGILRPLSEAGTVPDGCVRINGHFYADRWYLGWQKDDKDTHFADIRLPSTETPATKAADPYARLKAYAKAGARIRCKDKFGWSGWEANGDWGWYLLPENYEVHPDDLHLVPEYAPANEQPKQQVPLGPEDVMPDSWIQFPCGTKACVEYIRYDRVKMRGLVGEELFNELVSKECKINRSIPLTGKWDANAWEPCYKMI